MLAQPASVRVRTFVCCMVLVVMFSAVVPAQAFELGTVTDTSCTTITQVCAGPDDHGCNSTRFFVEGPGTYTLTASIDNCTGGTSCTGCQTEAYLYKDDNTTLVRCIHSGCCTSISDSNVPLDGGTYYHLYCCKIPCGLTNCGECGSTCVSRAAVQ
jgi:hypothetical protein